ncbi:hypothetical protein Pla123a_05050 [Posidoniimonas polymericola]|uniref:Uncharacterized protein n=1 Tax=Posidoniimonas polymericola TaxID=2528002 RepID=A0A5C5ZEV9_9BACT|nr:hypothetical protein [Posidoniimonas polymericola]TWT85698.1 hypothetical protein Pla123a_05050 [Posidoniimonas polymericola]
MSGSPQANPHAQRLADLDQRHDDLIDEIEALNTRIEAALAELLPSAATSDAPAAPTC